MVEMISFFVFVFGMIIGSFLNVVILRFNTGKDILHRSHCLSCGHTLSANELIPVISYVVQRGRCLICKSKISPQYSLVEIGTGALFALVYLTQVAMPSILVGWIISALLVIIVVYDLRHAIVPNAFVYTLVVISGALLFVNVEALNFALPSMSAVLAGPLLALPVGVLWYISGGRWIGLGDAKLFLAVGWLLGVGGGMTAFVLSFWIGALVSVALILIQQVFNSTKLNFGTKDLTMKTEVPFAPFIVLGFFIVYFLNLNLVTLLGV